jgi:hypothetical protein
MEWAAIDVGVSERTICKTRKKENSLNYWFRLGREEVILFENFVGQVLLYCTQKHCSFILHG